MPVYITRTVPHSTRVESFESRGLHNQTSAKVSELAIVVLSHTPIQNLIRFGNMSSELQGRITNTPVIYDGATRSILKLFSGTSPFEGPTLFVEMKHGGDGLNNLGMFEVATGKLGVYGGKPSVEQIQSIASMGIDFYQSVPAGNVNLAGYIAFVQAWRGIRAFMGVGGGSVEGGGDLGLQLSKEAGERMMKIDPIPAITGEGGRVVKAAIMGKDYGGTLPMSDQFIRILSTGILANGAGIKSIPTTQEVDEPGILFPYFPDMLEPDMEFAYSIFIQLFRKCLEDSEDGAMEAISVHRRGFRYLSSTRPGRIIQHIYLGIKLAMESGGEIVIVRDGGEYSGFLLMGAGLKIAIQNRVFSSLEGADLQKELSALNFHYAACEKIYSLLEAVDREDEEDECITLEQVQMSPRYIRRMIQSRSASEIEEIREELSKTISKLSYEQRYWDINSENLVRFARALRFQTPMDDEPLYVHVETLLNRNSEVLPYLAVFGAQSPSIYHGTHSLRFAPPLDNDPNLVETAGKRKVPHIPFYTRSTVTAAADWSTAHRNKSFRYIPADKTANGKGFSSAKKRDGFVGGTEFVEFYSSIREWMYRGYVQGQQSSDKGKRKAGDSGVDESGSSAKTKKTKFTFL